MQQMRRVLCGVLAVAIAASLAAPASATTLKRMDVEDLVAANDTVVVGQVLDARSYWNKDKTFILTDVRISVNEVVKGDVQNEITVTLMGGRVGDLTTLIIGGAELIPGKSYLLFLNEENLPGKARVQTVRDHCQGAFDLVIGKDGGLRAVSQANRHPLVPDRLGYIDAPGGVEGMPFNAMIQSIRDLAKGVN